MLVGPGNQTGLIPPSTENVNFSTANPQKASKGKNLGQGAQAPISSFFQATLFCSSYFQPVALRDLFCWVMDFAFPHHVVEPFLLLSLFMINDHHVPDSHDHLLSLCCRDQTLLGADIDFYNWENFQSVNYLNFNPLYTKTI